MKFGVVQFPGSNCDQDAYRALADVLGYPTRYIWHKDSTLGDVDCVVIPGGFSYGDYLRTGAIARFSPAMKAVAAHARAGGRVIGICNGFQILCEAHLLPGALIRNRGLQFICDWVQLRAETADFCQPGTVLRLPIAHGEGCYFAEPHVIEQLKRENRVLFRYVANPNGSVDDIAGICNERRNVIGLMPHPERACEQILGGEDGRLIFTSIVRGERSPARAACAP
jgi:phosphoribosylformylglycinamidine synthase I